MDEPTLGIPVILLDTDNAVVGVTAIPGPAQEPEDDETPDFVNENAGDPKNDYHQLIVGYLHDRYDHLNPQGG